MTITYQTLKYAGKFDKTVTVTTDSQQAKDVIVHLKGYVDPIPMGVMEMVPRKTELGEMVQNQAHDVQIVLKNAGDAPLTMSRIVSQKYGTVYYDGAQLGDIVLNANEERVVKLTLIPKEAGRFLDSILIFSDARNDVGQGYKGILSGTVK